MEGQNQKRKERNNSAEEWVKCQSKARPGKYNLFNKATGEIKWCVSECSVNDLLPNDKPESSGASTSKKSNDKERQAPLPKPQSKKTPAQDRLKRLQHSLRKEQKKKKPTVKERNNNVNEEEKAAGTADKLLEPSTTAQKQNEESPCKPTCSRGTSSSTRKTESRTRKEPSESPLKSPSSKSPKASKRKRGISSANNADSPSTKVAKAEPEDRPHSSRQKPSSSRPPLEDSLPTKASKLVPEKASQNAENEPTAPKQAQSATSMGFVNRIKRIYHTTLESYNNAKKMFGQRSQESSVEKSNFKIPKKSSEAVNKPMAIQQTLKEMQSDDNKQTTLLYNPVTLTPTPATSAILQTDNKNTGTTPRSSNTLIIPAYERGSANNRLERLRLSLMQQAANGKMSSASKSCPSIPTWPTTQPSPTASQMAAEMEPMDWMPIEEPNISGKHSTSDTNIMSSSEPSRCELTVCEYYKAVNSNLMRLAAEQRSSVHFEVDNWLKDHYYFVIDTNVMLENLTFVEDLSKMQLCDTQGTILFIPYCVLQELDKLKQSSPKESVKLLANRAIKFLNSKFEAKSKHVIAQSATNEMEELIEVKCPDDRILNCCMQVKQHIEHVLLLTEDVNLRNKAICNNILVSTKSDLVSLHPKN